MGGAYGEVRVRVKRGLPRVPSGCQLGLVNELDFDAVILGGGSAGYAAARTLAAGGARTAVIDGAPELGGLMARLGVSLSHPEHGMLVRVEGDRLAV